MKKSILICTLCVCSCFGNLFAQEKSAPTKDTVNIEDVVVTGSRVSVLKDNLSVPISIISREVLESSGESDVFSVLSQQVPNLFVTTRGVAGYGISTGAAGGVYLRGFSGGSGRVLVLIDGHPQYAPLYGHPIADAYLNEETERVEVSRGASSVIYGSNAMGGAINIITKKNPHNDGNHLHFRGMAGSYGTQSYQLSDSYKKGKFSAHAGVGYESTDGHRSNSAYHSANGMLKLGYRISDHWNITANANVVDFYAENPGDTTAPMVEGWVDVLRTVAELSVENHYEKTDGGLFLYHNWGKHKIDDGHTASEEPQANLFHSTDYMYGMNLYQAVHLFEGNTLTGGIDVKLYGGEANKGNTIYTQKADSANLNEVAGYLLLQQALGRFYLNAGVRLEHHTLYGLEWVPQAGITYRAAENTHLKLSFSKGFRTPNMREFYMYASANEALLPERSLSYDFSVNQRLLDNKLQLELNLFYTTGDNLVEVVRENNIPQNRNIGDFSNKGLEFGANYQALSNLRFNLNYSYLDMEKAITGAPTHKLYAGVQYKPGDFSFHLGAQHIHDLYLVTGDSPVMSNFTTIDLSASYRIFDFMEIFAKAENLTNQPYETIYGYPMPGITVMGGLSLNF